MTNLFDFDLYCFSIISNFNFYYYKPKLVQKNLANIIIATFIDIVIVVVTIKLVATNLP